MLLVGWGVGGMGVGAGAGGGVGWGWVGVGVITLGNRGITLENVLLAKKYCLWESNITCANEMLFVEKKCYSWECIFTPGIKYY